jgi:endoglucanase
VIFRLLLMLALVAFCPVPADAAPPADRLAVLRRGVNLTNWFRYPASLDPARLRAYLSDAAIADLRRAGFGFVRLAVQPEIVMAGDGLDPLRLGLLLDAVHRLQRQGLGVVIAPLPLAWRLESRQADRARLLGFWRGLSAALARSDPRLIFPEVLNEPVFTNDAAGWAELQALRPAADANVVYSFHFYDPAELTALAAYRPGLDTSALARLPFPMNPDACGPAIASTTDPATSGLIRFVCAAGWNQDRLRQSFAAAAAWARRHNAALLLGEFGATVRLNAAARLAWLTAARVAAEQQDIGWALWGYDDGMGFNVSRPPGVRPVLPVELLTALGLGDPAIRAATAPARSPRRSAQ